MWRLTRTCDRCTLTLVGGEGLIITAAARQIGKLPRTVGIYRAGRWVGPEEGWIMWIFMFDPTEVC